MIRVKTIEPGRTYETGFSLGVVKEEQLSEIAPLLSELKKYLTASGWPVEAICLKRRNPFYPDTSVTFVSIAFATSVLNAIGTKIGNHAFDWMKKKVKWLKKTKRTAKPRKKASRQANVMKKRTHK